MHTENGFVQTQHHTTIIIKILMIQFKNPVLQVIIEIDDHVSA
jgi:hypothetical protein